MNEFPERPKNRGLGVRDYVPKRRREEEIGSVLTNATHVWASCV